ncbi:hypothetical protein A5784_30790 [Mycobacterium sp. 852013-50091_SCH5140682]|uniref:hypothetical protein n=1 Tax=Mycobacterium sp. 852013-50091_SCH5140682 TaxID=1834109 RepID=UPI0007E9E7FA|nr:hypothetical protein [Mycobacterium sp. 852013-50091_SCH5140682]OBC14089.1 hypothetical protein A5784_30790 [Mycobacterium sp. 852013-50091_SCH5140682]
MTMTPAEHYQRADELLAELEQADPQVAPKLPHVAFKLRLAELHAQLAQSPWWPDLFDEPDYADFDDPDPGAQRQRLTQLVRRWPIETRSATGDRL